MLVRVLAILIYTLSLSEANASTYHVTKGGSDSNSCALAQSTSTSKLTIQNGLRCVGTGDVLDIHAGTYAETIDAQVQAIPTGTSWENAPLITGHAGETVILKPTSGGWIIGMTQGYIQYVRFENLTTDGALVPHPGGDGIKVMNGANHIRFTNMEVKNSGQGILASVGSGPAHGQAYCEYRKMKVHDNGRTAQYDHGFYIETGANTIEDSEIYNNATYGIQLYRQGSTTLPSNNIVRRNYIHNNGRISVRGGMVVSGPNNLIENNIIVNNGPEGIEFGFGAVNNNNFFHNVVYGHSLFGIHIRSGMNNNQIINNISYGNGSNIINDASSTTQMTNFTKDPSFVNATGGNFHLQVNSSAINTGVATSTVADYDGNARPYGSAYDIGAFEYVSGILPPAMPTSLQATPQ